MFVILFCVLHFETYFYSHLRDRLEIHKGDIHMEGGKIVGGAISLMEAVGSWISGKVLQGGYRRIISLIRQAPAPGSNQPYSRAGNTPHIF